MSNTFEWTRFTKVVRKDWHNMLRHYTSIIFMAASPAFAWLLLWIMTPMMGDDTLMIPGVRLVWIFSMGCLASVLAPAILYNTFNQPKQGIYFAMLPASKLEKYLSIILYSVIVYPLAVILSGVVVDLFLSVLPFGPYKNYLWETSMTNDLIKAIQGSEVGTMVTSPIYWIAIFILSYLSSASEFLFGATFFKKHKFIFTILWLYLIGFVLQLILTPIFLSQLGSDNFAEWMQTTPEASAVNGMLWGMLIFQAILCGILFWWAGHRLKKMAY